MTDKCKYGDKYCPCQDGDMCHYEGENPMMPIKTVSEAIKFQMNKSSVRGSKIEASAIAAIEASGAKYIPMLLETLQFYATKDNWQSTEKHMPSCMAFDLGDRAQKAIAQLPEGLRT